MKRHSQQGVALVITLILLSVITFMAVTFLVVSRREGAQVNTLTQQSNAKFAADAAVEQAKAMIGAQMAATTNGFNFGLMVSTNLVSQGFDNVNPLNYTNLNNVAYNYPNGTPLSQADLLRMLNNQLILPRVPVFITNPLAANSQDFRFYLDLNRNGVYDTNGPVTERDINNNPVVNNYIGDPEWIGVLNHPDQRHSASNLYVARFCYIALPIGNSLDMNFIHNQAQQLSKSAVMPPAQDDGYLRNEGVGSWELNLAGFLSALNTNFWGPAALVSQPAYGYSTDGNNASRGVAFADAAAIVQYRYNSRYDTLPTFDRVYGPPTGNPNAPFLFGVGYIDPYSIGGPLLTNVYPTFLYSELTKANSQSWSGSQNPNAFFTTQDLFGSIPSPGGQPSLQSFTNRLYSVGRTYSSLINSVQNSITNSYNRYTYYRLLSQMSFGSSAEPDNYPYSANGNPNFTSAYPYPSTPKMNLNFNNIGTNVGSAFVALSATNFIPWTPIGFFTNAADRMLRAYFPNPISYTVGNTIITTNLSINNIPIYPVNFYTPAVHRILQLAANMYDATTSRAFNDGTSQSNLSFPSVFAPYFKLTKTGVVTNISIVGYLEVSNYTQNIPGLLNVAMPCRDLRRSTDANLYLRQNNNTIFGANFYGVPYVIGAKSGFPNFNKFCFSPVVQVFRKLEVIKPSVTASPSDPGWHTNAQYIIGISNVFGMECWNSSRSNYGRGVTIYVANDYGMALTISNNNVALVPPSIVTNYIGIFTNVPAFTWGGSPLMLSATAQIKPASFSVPLQTNVVVRPDSVLRINPTQLTPTDIAGPSITFDTTPGYFIPSFTLNVTNRVRVVMVDTTTQRVIDCVQLGGLGQLPGPDLYNDNINNDLVIANPQAWSTNVAGPHNPAPAGFYNQLTVSQIGTSDTTVWLPIQLPPNTQVSDAVSVFSAFMGQNGNGQLSDQAPYSAFTKYSTTYVYSPNDPLVHYMTTDLTDLTSPNNYFNRQVSLTATNPLSTFVGVFIGTNKYQPWGIFGGKSFLPDVKNNQLAYKDPLITLSDAWQFPSNSLPNVGWLGRVHRGTPWQTVYLKSSSVDNSNWIYWTGNNLGNYFGGSYPSDSTLMQPTNDWLLMDLFTTSPNENASRGQLSVNQTGLAAWSAVLDGVCVLNNTAKGVVPQFIDPTNTYVAPGTSYFTNAVQYIVSSISSQLQSVNAQNQPIYPGGIFRSAGQILSVPQLTVASPYINTNIPATMSDAVMERIPQQIMSLLRVGTPKYVIFAYGQSLRPADHSIVSSGQFLGMCTNYQITGEVATRTVVRFDNAPIPGQAPTAPQAVVESFNVLPPE